VAQELNISFDKARMIHTMADKKGVHSKQVEGESEDDELKITPQMVKVSQTLF